MQHFLLREKVIKSFQKQGLLIGSHPLDVLLEYGYHPLDGSIESVFAETMKGVKSFGKLLGASAKVMINDVSHLITLTFGKSRSWEEYKKLNDNYKKRKRALWKEVSTHSKALDEQMPDGAKMMLLFNPGLYLTTRVGHGIMTGEPAANIKSKFQGLGLENLPVIEGLLNPKNNKSALNHLKTLNPNDSEEVNRGKIQAFLKGDKIDLPGTGKVSSLLFNTINDIFVNLPEGRSWVILEGEEDEEAPPDQKVIDVFNQEIAKLIEAEWPVDRGEFLKEREEYFEEVLQEAEETLKANANLGSAKTSEEFFKAVEELKKVGGDQAADIDVEVIKTNLKELVSNFFSDEKQVSKFKENALKDKSLEEDDDEDKLKQLFDETMIAEFKSQFLEKWKAGLYDYYDYIEDQITDGADEEDLKLIQQTKFGKQYVDQIQEYKQRIAKALSNL